MKIWLVYTYESIVGIDEHADRFRYGELSRSLCAAGHSVCWWQSTFNHLTKKYRFRENTNVDFPGGLTVKLIHGPGYRTNVSFARVRHNRTIASRLAIAMAQESERPNLVLAGLPSVEAAEVACSYAQLHAIPFALDAHDMWPDIYLKVVSPSFRPAFRYLLRQEFKRASRIANGADIVTAVSQTYLDWVRSYRNKPIAPERAAVFTLGFGRRNAIPAMEDPLKRHSVPRGKFIAIFVGTFGAFYDLETIVRAARTAQSRGLFNIHFVLVGDGDKFEWVRRTTQLLRNITITGRIGQAEAFSLLQAANVGLSAYTRHATQSLPYKLFEYMGAGLPQISSLQGEAKILLARTRAGVSYQAGNPDQLLERIERLAGSPRTVRYMGMKARGAFERKYDMNIIYPEMAKYITGLALRDRPKPPKPRRRILYVHQHFSLPTGFSGTRPYAIAKQLVEAGDEVTIICGYTDNSGFGAAYRKGGALCLDGIQIRVCRCLYSNHMSFKRRVVSFLIFAVESTWIALITPHDFIYASSTPLSAALPGLAVKVLFPGRRFVFEERDRWPAAAVAAGALRSSPLIALFSRFERTCYRMADACVALSPDVAAAMRSEGAGGSPIVLAPNTADLALFDFTRRRPLRPIANEPLKLIYIGAIGYVNGLEMLLGAASELAMHPEINFKITIAGDGVRLAFLKREAARRGLTSLSFIGRVSRQAAAEQLFGADVGIMIMQNKEEFQRGTSPNKFFDYLAAGLPILNTYPGWLSELINEHHCGITVDSRIPGAIASGIMQLGAMTSKELEEMGANARKLAETQFDRNAVFARIPNLIDQLAGIPAK